MDFSVYEAALMQAGTVPPENPSARAAETTCLAALANTAEAGAVGPAIYWYFEQLKLVGAHDADVLRMSRIAYRLAHDAIAVRDSDFVEGSRLMQRVRDLVTDARALVEAPTVEPTP